MVTYVGADPKRMGWVAVVADDQGLRALKRYDTLATLAGAHHDAAVIGVAAPLGHDDAEGRQGGRRAADEAARGALGPNKELIAYAVPPLLYGSPSRDEAVAEAKARGWPVPNEHQWTLRGRFHEAGAAAHRHADQPEGPRLVEVMPELSFQAMQIDQHGAGHVAHGPRTFRGITERLHLLHAYGLRPARSFGGIGRAHPEDVLQATAAAWSAMRVAQGTAMIVPPADDPTAATGVRVYA